MTAYIAPTIWLAIGLLGTYKVTRAARPEFLAKRNDEQLAEMSRGRTWSPFGIEVTPGRFPAHASRASGPCAARRPG